MPRISDFFGIIIAMYYNDHGPPHFHASYVEYEATVNIETLEVIAGSLPTRALGLVLEWAAMHRMELRDNWAAARQGVPLSPIDGLE